jgi:hypothetical protein
MSAKRAINFMFFRPSVLQSARISSTLTGRIFVKLDIGGFYSNLSRNSRFVYNLTKITVNFREDVKGPAVEATDAPQP